MCRLFGFRSSVASSVHTSLVAAENALAYQSKLHPDGWGIATYTRQFPQLIRNDRQALGDALFSEITSLVATRTLLAHIRQATVGEIGILNCHPFQHGPWTFAHNGHIAGFSDDDAIRAEVMRGIDPRFRGQVLGSTDSEVIFYIFLSQLARRVEDVYHGGIRSEVVIDALEDTVDHVFRASPDEGADPEAPTRLTILLTNGSVLVGLKHRRTLFFSTYKSLCPERDTCHAYEPARCEQEVRDGIVKHLVVASERVADGPNVWIELQDGDWVTVDHGMNFHRGRLECLSDGVASKLSVVEAYD